MADPSLLNRKHLLGERSVMMTHMNFHVMLPGDTPKHKADLESLELGDVQQVAAHTYVDFERDITSTKHAVRFIRDLGFKIFEMGYDVTLGDSEEGSAMVGSHDVEMATRGMYHKS